MLSSLIGYRTVQTERSDGELEAASIQRRATDSLR